MTTTAIESENRQVAGIEVPKPVQIVNMPVPKMALLPSAHEYQVYLELADKFIESGFLPSSITRPAQALAIMLTGRELGLPPMLALRSLHIIEGKPGMSAELILARFRQAGGKYRWLETTDRIATIEAVAPGNRPDWVERFSFTIEEAERAGVTGKGNWRKYPAAMLRARAASLMVRAIAPEVSAGLHDPDELGAITTETGDIEWPERAVNPEVERKVASDDRSKMSVKAQVVTDDDPVLPIEPVLSQGIRLSDYACKLVHVLAFLYKATEKPELAKRYAAIIQKAWAFIPLKLQDATLDELTKTSGWIFSKDDRVALFREFIKPIEARLEALNEMMAELTAEREAASTTNSENRVATIPTSEKAPEPEDVDAELESAFDNDVFFGKET